MTSALDLLSKAQHLIASRNQHPNHPEFCEKLVFCSMGELLHVEYYGDSFGESYEDFLKLLCLPEVAGKLASLELRGPDEGANGTRNWDLTPLLESEVIFPRLRSIVVQPTLPEHHNQTIIASVYEEDGQIGRLLAKASSLQSLTVPSAPDVTFFGGSSWPLEYLRVESG
jgi:hypothetical protein